MPCRNLCEQISVKCTNGSFYNKGSKYCRRYGVFSAVISYRKPIVFVVEEDCVIGLVIIIIAKIENAVQNAIRERWPKANRFSPMIY